jgi:hypothetical protein
MLALSLSCVPPGAAAQTRTVSVAGIRLDPHRSMRSFKGIICDDVSEFESYMPSQPVQSLWDISPLAQICDIPASYHDNRAPQHRVARPPSAATHVRS